MKKTYLTFCLLFLSHNLLFATHNKGGEITYEVLNAATRTFRATITTYTHLCAICPDRDYLDSVHWGDNTTERFYRDNFLDIGDSTRKNQYIATHSYAGNGIYVISFTDPNRNAGIVNISNSVNIPFCTESKLVVNPNYGVNNTVQFQEIPIFKGEVNRPFRCNPMVIDPDGDSLSFELIVPLAAPNTPVTGYTNPGNLTVNPISGQMQWNTSASPGPGNYVFAVRIYEWRCGFQMGYVIRDFQISLISTFTDTLNVFAPLTLSQDASGNYFTSVNPGDTVNVHAVYYYSTAGNISCYGGGVVQLSAGPGTAIADFTWVPDSIHSRSRPYIFTFRGTSTTTPPRKTDLTFLVYVNGPDSTCYTIGIDELQGNLNAVSIFPNPATTELRIQNSELRIENIGIYNLPGEKIYSQQPETSNQEYVTVNVSALTPGIYFVRVKTREGIKVAKFVKQ